MKNTVLLFALFLLRLMAQVAEAGPVRVVSQTVGTDELLLALAAPSQIAALSHLSREAIYSATAEEAKGYPQLSLNCDLEGALKFQPTLILCANYSRVELVTQARRAGLKVIVFEKYRTIEDAYENLRLLARELGLDAEAKAERIIANCESRIAVLHKRLEGVKPVRVIAPSTYGMIPGDDSTFQDLCDHAGAENLGYTLGGLHGHEAQPNEKMLTWPVDRVVLSGDNPETALAVFRKISPYQFMSAVKEGRVALVKYYQLSCVSHRRIDGYEQLAQALHPECFP